MQLGPKTQMLRMTDNEEANPLVLSFGSTEGGRDLTEEISMIKQQIIIS